MATITFGNFAVNMDDPNFLDSIVGTLFDGSFGTPVFTPTEITDSFTTGGTLKIEGSFSIGPSGHVRASSPVTGLTFLGPNDALLFDVSGLSGLTLGRFSSLSEAQLENLFDAQAHTVVTDGFNDVLVGDSSNETAMAGGGDDILRGNGGRDILDGGPGADQMDGGRGNDTYMVDNPGDSVVETVAGAAGGVDLVKSSVSFVLGPNVENLTLTGSDNIDGKGNAGNNVLRGNSGNNILDGGTAGADRLIGGAGDDTYVVDHRGEVVTEGANAGNDTVQSGVGFTLGPNVEKLILTGTGNINGTGNALDNTLIGNAGNNVLSGGAGADLLDGGGGSDLLRGGVGDDMFIFDAADKQVAGGAGRDTLKFTGAGQTLDLSGKVGPIYTGLEVIDLTGTGDNALSLSKADVLKLTGPAHDLVVSGNAGDSISSTGQGWVQGADQTIGGVLYHSYSSGAAHLHVQADITAVLS